MTQLLYKWGMLEGVASARSTKAQKEKFDHLVTNHTMVHEQMQFFLRGFRRDAHPMAVLTGLVGALSAFFMTARTSTTLSIVRLPLFV